MTSQNSLGRSILTPCESRNLILLPYFTIGKINFRTFGSGVLIHVGIEFRISVGADASSTPERQRCS